MTTKKLSHSDIARMGAEATNRNYTTEKRKEAALKGWANRRKNKERS